LNDNIYVRNLSVREARQNTGCQAPKSHLLSQF